MRRQRISITKRTNTTRNTTRTPHANAQSARTAGKRMRYIPALDGLRTLAVAAVVLYHLHLPWAQGGLLGVTVFFALSGYLITRLLIGEFDTTGTIDLKSFWVRRVRRLLPAIGAVVLVTVVLCTLFNHVMLTKMRPDIIPSLLFVNNWWQIINQVSYFNALGDPSPLTHFWSLAIEEQFYLVWPPVLFVLLRCGVKRAWVRRIALGAAVASAVAMAVLYDPAADPSRLYYGTDTRAFSLLFGAWLAFIPERSMSPARLLEAVGLDRLLPAGMRATLPSDGDEPTDSELAAINGAAPSTYAPAVERTARRRASSAPRTSAPALSIDILAIAGIAGLALMVGLTNGYTSFQYQGGTLLATLLTLLVIAGCVQEGGLVARALALPPLVWLGKRSYSIYLWHYPLLLLMNPVSNVSQTPWWLMIIQVVVVIGAAELSYHFVETPCRKGAIGEALHRMCVKHATVPVIVGGFGVTHIYVDDTADIEKSVEIIINDKVQKPSACNALDTILVHRERAMALLHNLAPELAANKIIVHAHGEVAELMQDYPYLATCTAADLDTEFLGLHVNIVMVDGVNDALQHLRKHKAIHSDAILTNTWANAELFTKGAPSACVYVNASPRFSDGGQFGLGAEVAISTQKLHARGPMGLEALTTYQYVCSGDYLSRE